MDQVALAECTTEELGDALAQVHAIENATRSALLELVVACDERKVWVEDGCASLESWLATRLGVAWRTTAELVRVARRLEDLPRVAAVFADGGLSWDKVRAVAAVATAETDESWAESAPSTAVCHLERAARSARERSEAEGAAAHVGRGLGFREHRDHPVTRIAGWVPNDQAAVIRTAIEREADRIPANPETGQFDSYAARRADALYKICSQAIGADTDADRATVVVYEQAGGSVTLPDGTVLPDSVAQRLRCDCREQHADGSVDQVISPALRRKILRRDGGCTFPGCEQRHWVQIHHVVHRSKGGPTVPWNLRSECPLHHRVLHLPGWRTEWDPEGILHYYRPDGTE
ncbi:MAG: hypothetical protein JWP02_1630, partial [Acidimicrobiales bacterium]|nr:hypothetical protein [Acidimicrobiales bacterium]